MDNVKVTKDMTYDQTNKLQLDYYESTENSSKTVVIDIHGGGWFRGDKQKDVDLATAIAKLGYQVVVPNYRLTPDNHFPAPLEDMDQLVKWLREKFSNPSIIAVGSSAGGNMAVELGIKYGFPSISLSGILAIDSWLEGHEEVVGKPDTTQDFTNAASATINQTGHDDSFYKWFLMNYLNNDMTLAEKATPYRRVGSTAGPMMLVNSLNEFVPTSGVFTLAERLVQNNVPVETTFLPGTQHAKGYLEQVWPQIELFLNKYSL